MPLTLALLLSTALSLHPGHGPEASGWDFDAPAEESADPKSDADWDVANPPGTRKTIEIDVEEGTWMSLDVSPDGKTIAFDLLGDIYVMPFEGGDATPIAEGMAWEMQPRFSPDGAMIAFTSDRAGGDNIWVMDADGENKRQISKESFRLLNNPTWSPDGRFIAARKHWTTRRSLGTGSIQIYHLDGGAGLEAVARPSETHQKELGEPAWSADGQYIYYSQNVTPGGTFIYAQDSNGEVFNIRRYDIARDAIETVVDGAGGGARPEPSPDGRWLAFVKRERAKSKLYVRDLQTGAEGKIYDDLDQDMQEVWAVHGVYPNMDWTPDSKTLVFWAGGKIRRIDVASGETAVIPFHVDHSREVIAAPRPVIDVAPETFRTTNARFAEVSPDGSRVVFESLGKLYVQDLPNGRPRRLTRSREAFELFPSFSPDGRIITFVSWTDEGLGDVMRVASGSGSARRVSREPGHYMRPRFSPDGRTIVVRRATGGYLRAPEYSVAPGLYALPASGGEASLIARDGRDAHFTEDGRIYFTRDGGGKHRLLSVKVDGSDEKSHAVADYVTSWRMAPGGDYIAFTENYNVYVAPTPGLAKEVSLNRGASSVPVKRASGPGGFEPRFTEDGRLFWSVGAELYATELEDLFADDYDAPEEPYADLSVEAKKAKPEGRVALTGARIITMAGEDGGVIEDGVILIEGDRILEVGAADDVEIPQGAKTVDLAGKTVTPGFIDAHAHGPQSDGAFIPQQNWEARATLALGVTTIHDPSNNTDDFHAASSMQRAGLILGPRMYSTGTIVYGAKSEVFADIGSYEDALNHVRRLKKSGAISVKNYNQPRRDQRQQVTAAAQAEGLMTFAEGGALFQMDLAHVADGVSGVEHNLPQATLYEDVLAFYSGSDAGYTPTLVVAYGGLTAEHYWEQETEVWKHPILSRHVPPAILEASTVRRTKAPTEDYAHIPMAREANRLAERGVPVSIGAHGQREGLGSHWEVWGFAQGGASPLQALERATTHPARNLGMTKDLGSIEPGKLADLVVMNSNPLEDIYKTDDIAYVVQGGRIYDPKTLNEVETGDHESAPYWWR